MLPTLNASRHHFAISADGENAYVEDLGSANGTWLEAGGYSAALPCALAT